MAGNGHQLLCTMFQVEEDSKPTESGFGGEEQKDPSPAHSCPLLKLPNELLLTICELSEVRYHKVFGKYSYRGTCSLLSDIGLAIICSRVRRGQIRTRLNYWTTESSLSIIEAVSRNASLAVLITDIECKGMEWNLEPKEARSYRDQQAFVDDADVNPRYNRKALRQWKQEIECRAVMTAQIRFQQKRCVVPRLREALSKLINARILTFSRQKQDPRMFKAPKVFRNKMTRLNMEHTISGLYNLPERHTPMSPWKGFAHVIRSLSSGTCHINKLALIAVGWRMSELSAHELQCLDKLLRTNIRALDIREQAGGVPMFCTNRKSLQTMSAGAISLRVRLLG
jgi:hypothetical protein